MIKSEMEVDRIDAEWLLTASSGLPRFDRMIFDLCALIDQRLWSVAMRVTEGCKGDEIDQIGENDSYR